ncbi:hypothetical protein [Calothrix rhizosoleniae]|uniref:hypothetical protein n=1 Tax=Calothrix rhizosoleniae TaxID=888997 RepID=UPI0011773D7B|nr:hypothetical protein [Calothrix rhizosoleniae]
MHINDLKLYPLRIPTGWKVTHNRFYEFDPHQNPTLEGVYQDNPWLVFVENLLQLQHTPYPFLIDLGWYPEADPKGNFRLSLIKNQDWNQPLRIYESKSGSAIVEKIEDWLREIGLKFGNVD